MNRRGVLTILLLSALTGCLSAPSTASHETVWTTIPASLQIPIDVERLAVLYPKTYNRELIDAYARLAGATFQLKEQRPALRIVDRFDLPTVRGEQLFQLDGTVSDATAVSLGRLLGVDSVLFYRIEGPTVRDKALSKLYGEMPPFTFTSKIVRVESAEVLYHNVVTVPVQTSDDELEQPHFRMALQQGIAQTIADLQRAFQ